ncbi:hypothetical protein [Pedobacter sp. CFBP9032]|uniref:hypothetical protein n=1 Tax=Pedobacter sp. CFBP9032 TaxID=3096539 RepID=UPI002A6A457E|nr:hypothetical protein [Pedobacter sp. CFBP9032]MDY0903615.1 hypothetical protein [Pedobacter sp. CFBP9032]
MKTFKEKFKQNFILGCIKYNNEFTLYLMPIAWWILNYVKYDPTIQLNESGFKNFRQGVLNVLDNKIQEYLDAIEEDKISNTEYINIVDNFSSEDSRITFFIDFDSKIYVNGFYDIEVKEYLPNESWKGKFDEPMNYIPINSFN